ncbi:MAG: hypothetical protein ABI446_15135 [Gemmatimonadaceae bacterium]
MNYDSVLHHRVAAIDDMTHRSVVTNHTKGELEPSGAKARFDILQHVLLLFRMHVLLEEGKRCLLRLRHQPRDTVFLVRQRRLLRDPVDLPAADVRDLLPLHEHTTPRLLAMLGRVPRPPAEQKCGYDRAYGSGEEEGGGAVDGHPVSVGMARRN